MRPRIHLCDLAALLIVGSTSLFATDLQQLASDAQNAWTSEKFEVFAKLSSEIERDNPTFAVSFNVALGLFRSGENAAALSKIIDVQQRYMLSPGQAEKTSKLRLEIETYIKYLSTARERRSGSVTLSKDGQYSRTGPCPGDTRSASCIGIKPEMAAKYMEELNRQVLIANGHNVPVKYSSISPE